MRQLALLGWWLVCFLIIIIGGLEVGFYYISLHTDDMPWFLYYAIRIGFHIFAHEDMPPPETVETVSWLVYLVISIALVGMPAVVASTLLLQHLLASPLTYVNRCKEFYKQSFVAKGGGFLWAICVYSFVTIVTCCFLNSDAEQRGRIEPAWAFVSLIVIPVMVGIAMKTLGRTRWLKGFLTGTVFLWALSLFVAHAISHLDLGPG